MQTFSSDFKPHTNHLSIFGIHSCNVCVCKSDTKYVSLCACASVYAWMYICVHVFRKHWPIRWLDTIWGYLWHLPRVPPIYILRACLQKYVNIIRRGSAHPRAHFIHWHRGQNVCHHITSQPSTINHRYHPPHQYHYLRHHTLLISYQNAITIKLFKWWHTSLKLMAGMTATYYISRIHLLLQP